MRERADRLETLAGFIATPNRRWRRRCRKNARLAGRYAKADLSTGLVGDMASLQGIVGGEYAERQGLPEPACWAIASHYDHKRNRSVETESAKTSMRLCLADNLDKLIGYLGLGLVPTGSSDPYGLRRATTMLIEIALAWPEAAINYKQLSLEAIELYRAAGKTVHIAETENLLMELFAGRFPTLFPSVRYDVVEAATPSRGAKACLNPFDASRESVHSSCWRRTRH